MIATGIIDEIEDPHNNLSSKFVSLGSTLTTSVTLKPTDDNFHFSGLYAPMPESWEISGLPPLSRLTGVSLAFALAAEPTPDTNVDVIDEDFLSSFVYQESYARIPQPWAIESTLASVVGTIVEVMIFQEKTLTLVFKITDNGTKKVSNKSQILQQSK